MKKKLFLINILICFLFTVFGFFTDNMIKWSVYSFIIFFSWVTFLILLYSLEIIVFSIQKRKLSYFLFGAIAYAFGSLYIQIGSLIETGSFIHFFGGHFEEGSFFGVFMFFPNYIFAIPAGAIGLLIDGIIYLIRKRKNILAKMSK